ncbi:hypothetical protein ACTWQL_03685 [Pseudalkalibacillus sp. R45]|uniref:hypothetical protein n=1 Tax=Pseudalkalibacillus sp. R45 TaxID=3457433 RepID=UPI003FCDD545
MKHHIITKLFISSLLITTTGCSNLYDSNDNYNKPKSASNEDQNQNTVTSTETDQYQLELKSILKETELDSITATTSILSDEQIISLYIQVAPESYSESKAKELATRFIQTLGDIDKDLWKVYTFQMVYTKEENDLLYSLLLHTTNNSNEVIILPEQKRMKETKDNIL